MSLPPLPYLRGAGPYLRGAGPYLRDAGPYLRGAGSSCFVDFSGSVARELREEAHGRRSLLLRIGGARIPLQIRDRGPIPSLCLGDIVHGRAMLQRASSGSPRLASYLSLIRIEASASLLRRARHSLLAAIRARWRSLLRPDHESLVALLVLGQRQGFDPYVRRRHQVLGLAHLLAISGLHTVFVAGLLLLLLRALPLGSRLWPWLGLCLLGYAWLTGFRAPVVRAAIATTMWLAGREEGLRFDLGGALSLGLWVTLLLFPAEFGSISFCLSYLAVASLAAIPPLFAHLRPQGGWRRWLFDAWLLSFAAQAGTSALGLHYFGILSPWGAIMTPFLLPLILGILALALLALPAGLLLPGLERMLLMILDQLCALDLSLVEKLEQLPGVPIIAATMQGSGVAMFMLGAGLALALLLRSRWTWLATCLLSCLPYFIPIASSMAPRFLLLPVGHGLAGLAHGSFGTVLFDCGDSFGGRNASRQVLSALDELGERKLDILIVSHGDIDHYSGFERLLDTVRIGQVIVPECPELDALVRRARLRRIPVQVVPSGGLYEPRPGLRLLLPLPEGELEGGNESALALELKLSPGCRVLVCGDQEAAAARKLAKLAQKPELLVLPHHGELHMGLVDLLRSLEPRVLWSSSGKRGPSSESWLEAGFAPPIPYSTARDGRLSLKVDAAGYRIASEYGRRLPPRNKTCAPPAGAFGSAARAAAAEQLGNR